MCHTNIWYHVHCLHVDRAISSVILCRKAVLAGYQCPYHKHELFCLPKFGRCSYCKSKRPKCHRYPDSQLPSVVDTNPQVDCRREWHWGLSDQIREEKQKLFPEWEGVGCLGDVDYALQWVGRVTELIGATRQRYFPDNENKACHDVPMHSEKNSEVSLSTPQSYRHRNNPCRSFLPVPVQRYSKPNIPTSTRPFLTQIA